MAEPDIKRIHFFDGLFLKEGEFQEEQNYHLHMRRRINYMMFQSSGVVPIDPTDLRVTPTIAKKFMVTAGMAISLRPDLKEGRELILTTDSAEFDLTALGYSGSDEAIVAIHYEPGLALPQIGVSPATETRWDEQAIITVHKTSDWPLPPRPDGEQYIRLGKVTFSDMHVDHAVRDTAVVRSTLFGGGASPGPSISSITPNTGNPGDNINAIIVGTSLGGVTTPDVTAPAADIANIVVNSSTPTQIDLSFDILPSATAGSKTITVNTSTGSATVSFLVVISSPAPILLTGIPNTPGTQLDPPIGTLGPPPTPFEVFGRNLRIDLPSLPTVELVDSSDTVTHVFVVHDVRLENEPGFGDYNVIECEVNPLSVPPPIPPITGKVRVTTSGGSVTSSENFTIMP